MEEMVRFTILSPSNIDPKLRHISIYVYCIPTLDVVSHCLVETPVTSVCHYCQGFTQPLQPSPTPTNVPCFFFFDIFAMYLEFRFHRKLWICEGNQWGGPLSSSGCPSWEFIEKLEGERGWELEGECGLSDIRSIRVKQCRYNDISTFIF